MNSETNKNITCAFIIQEEVKYLLINTHKALL